MAQNSVAQNPDQLSQSHFTQNWPIKCQLHQTQLLQNQLANTVAIEQEQQFDHNRFQECMKSVSDLGSSKSCYITSCSYSSTWTITTIDSTLSLEQDDSQPPQHHTLQQLLREDLSVKHKVAQPVVTMKPNYQKTQQQGNDMGTIVQSPVCSEYPVVSLTSLNASYSATGELQESSQTIDQALTQAPSKEKSVQKEYTEIGQKLKKEMPKGCPPLRKVKKQLRLTKDQVQKLISDPGATLQKVAGWANYIIIQEGDEKKYVCSKCGNIYQWRKSVKQHWTKEHDRDICRTILEGNEKKYSCLVCGNVYSLKGYHRKHWQIKHNEEVPYPKSTANMDPNVLNLLSNSHNIPYLQRRKKNSDAEISSINGTFIRPDTSQSSTSLSDQLFDEQEGVLDLSNKLNPEFMSQRQYIPEQEQSIDISYTGPLVQVSSHPLSTKLSQSGEGR